MYNKDNTREADEIFSRILSEMERQGRKYAELTDTWTFLVELSVHGRLEEASIFVSILVRLLISWGSVRNI